jgi:hypothetical protein
MRLGSRSAAVVALAFHLTLCASAAAQPSPSSAERANARKLFDDGKTKRDKGDVQGALEAFKQADAIMQVPTTRLAVARELAAAGRLLEARESAASVEKMPAVGKEPPPFIDARSSAADLVKQLDGKIPTLTFAVSGAEGGDLAIKVDDVAVSQTMLQGPFRVNPGAHVVAATSAGRRVVADVTVTEGETRAVTLTLPQAEASAVQPTDQPSRPPSFAKPLLIGGLGVAVVGVGVGTVAGIISLGKTSDLGGQCADNKCPPPAHDTLDAAHTTATISTIGFVAAAVGLVAAGTGFLLGRPRNSQATGVRATVTIGGGGLEGVF